MRRSRPIAVAIALLGIAAAGCDQPGPGPAAQDSSGGSAPRRDPAAVCRARVVVRDFAGTPLGGVRVVACPPRPRGFAFWPGLMAPTQLDAWRALPPGWDLAPHAEAKSGADGRCELTGLAPGAWQIAVDHPGRVRRAALCSVAEGGAAPEVEIRTGSGTPLEGRVLARSGVPVPGATVLAEYPGIAPGGRCLNVARDFALVRADGEGRYRFDALPASVVSVTCGPPGAWSSHEWPVDVASVPAVDLHLDSRGPLRGVVTSERDGKPVAGADVVFSVETWHTARVTAHATTGADGRYEIPVYPGEGVLSISVHAPGWWTQPRVIGGREPPFRLYEDRPTEIELSARPDSPEFADVRGVVRGPDGPIPGATLYLSTHDGSYWMSAEVTTDAEGRFHVLDVPRRRVRVVVSEAAGLYLPGAALDDDDGGAPDTSAPWWIAADAPRPADVEIALVRGGRVTGRVLDDAGTPVAGATVRARGAATTSADDGTFTLDGLAEPRGMSVFAFVGGTGLKGESAEFTAGAGKDADGVEVRLHVTPAPASARTIVVTGSVRADEDGVATDGARIECGGAWVPLGDPGTFRLEAATFLTPPQIGLIAVIPGFGRRVIEVGPAPGAATANAGEVVVPRAASIDGRVTGEDGPLSGVPVTIELRDDSGMIDCGFGEDAQAPIRAVTGGDGSFRARDIPDGTYTVRAAVPGRLEEEATVHVEGPHGKHSAWLHLPREAWIRGRVVLGDGRPVADAELEAGLADGTGSTTAGVDPRGRTDIDGEFALRVRAGAKYRIEVRPGLDLSKYAGRTGTEAAPPPPTRFLPFTSERIESGGEPVRLVAAAGARIAGRVVDADGAAVADARVTVSRKDRPGDDAVATTDPRGRFNFSGLGEEEHVLTVRAGLDAPVTVDPVVSGDHDVEVVLPVAAVIEGTLAAADGSPVSGAKLVATAASGSGGDWFTGDGRLTTATDDAGRFRFVRVGAEACRIEESGARRTWDSSDGLRSLHGGASVAPGTRDVALRVPSREETTIAGRIVDDAGNPFAGCGLEIRVRPNEITSHHGDFAGAEFEETNVRLDAPTGIGVCAAGLRWKFEVPPGTRDLVITAGADGVHRIEFGGSACESLRVELGVDADDPAPGAKPEVRLVHALTGGTHAARVPARRAETYPPTPIPVWFASVPVGPYRVECRDGPGDEWRPCKLGRVGDEPAFQTGR